MKTEWWCFEEMEKLFEWDSGWEKYWDSSATIIRRNEVIRRKFGFTLWLSMQVRLPLPLSCASSPASVLCPVIYVISDFGVLFCFNAFTKVSLAEWLIIFIYAT